MKLLFVLLFVLIHLSTSAQNNVRDYYAYKNKAELSIINNRLDSAHFYYNKAFTLHKPPLVRDIYNAFVVSYIIKDYAKAKEYYDNIIHLGFTKEMMLYYEFVKDIQDDSVYVNFIQTENKTKNFLIKLENVEEKISVLDSIHYYDQLVRNEQNQEQEYDKQKIYKVDSINAIALKQYIQKYGVPLVSSLGVHKLGNRVDSEGLLLIFLIHFIKFDGVSDAVYREKLFIGEHDPWIYAFYSDQSACKYGQLLNCMRKDPNIDEIDKNRKEIYLESHKEYIEKMKFLKTDNRFLFYPNFQFSQNKSLVK